MPPVRDNIRYVKRKERRLMFKEICRKCKEELEAPGATVTSPPMASDDNMVIKMDICAKCWSGLHRWIFTPRKDGK